MTGTELRWRSCAAHVDPGQAREHEVEQDEVGAVLVELRQRGGAGLGHGHLIALATQEVGQGVGVGLLVLDDEYAAHTWVASCGLGVARGTLTVSSVWRESASRRRPRTMAGRRRVNVEPRPGSDHTETSPPWLAATCLTIARPSPVPPVAPRPGGVDAVEPFEDALLVGHGDALALVGDRQLDDVAVDRSHGHRDARVGLGVGDRVAHEVADGGHEQGAVPPDRAVARGHQGDLDGLVLGGQPGPVDGVLSSLRQVDGVRLAERGGDLQPGQVDDLLHEPGQPGRLHLHPLGEPGHRLRVVVGVEDRLGQQGQPADGGLQLVRHVGDEVAPDLLEPAGLAAVVDEEQHVLGAQRRDPGADDEPRSTGRALRAARARPRGSRRRGGPAAPPRAAPAA